MTKLKPHIIQDLQTKTKLLVFVVLAILFVATVIIPKAVVIKWMLAICTGSLFLSFFIYTISLKSFFLKKAHRIQALIQYNRPFGKNKSVLFLQSEETGTNDNYFLLLTKKQKDKLVIQDNRIFINVNPAYPGKAYLADITAEEASKEKGPITHWISKNEGWSIALGIFLVLMLPVYVVSISLPPDFKADRKSVV